MSQGPGNMGTPPDYSFQMAVLRELDQLRRAVETAVARLESRDEERDAEVSELKLQVAALRVQSPSSNLKRDGGLVVSTGTVVAVLAGLAQWLATPPAPAPPRPPVAQVQAP